MLFLDFMHYFKKVVIVNALIRELKSLAVNFAKT